MYKLYCSLMKSIFENINYNISKKSPYYQEIYDKSQSYLKKIESDYELNGDKYIPYIIKSLITENYKLAKNVLPNLSKLILFWVKQIYPFIKKNCHLTRIYKIYKRKYFS